MTTLTNIPEYDSLPARFGTVDVDILRFSFVKGKAMMEAAQEKLDDIVDQRIDNIENLKKIKELKR